MATEHALRMAMVAGETSGDLLASLLLAGAKQRWPQCQAWGIGGERMQAQGFTAHWPAEALAVHGYSLEVLQRVYGIWQIRNALRQQLLADKPDVFVGIDAPDFNLGLERDLRQAGIKTVQFVCPSIWAWRPERVHTIKASVHHVLCIFPFEPDLLAQHGIASTYVGHPLANVIPMQPDAASARQALGLQPDAPVLALLPGSRSSEIRYLAPRFLQAAKQVLQHNPKVQLVLPAVPAHYERIQQQVQLAGLQGKVKLLQGQSHLALEACDTTLIASGTATLEAALYKRPMTIAYAMHPVSYHLMARKKLQNWVGLPNILCQDFVVPELLQNDATPDKLAHSVMQWLEDAAQVQRVQQRFTELHHLLQRDTSRLATEAIANVIR